MNRSQPLKNYPSKQEITPDDIINQLNIRYRVCYVYTQKNTDEEEICECGKPKKDHHFQEERRNATWDMALNTKEKVDTRHGRLPNNAWFVRLALDTPEEKVEKILLEAWKIPKPRFIVSIIGGAKYFKLNDRLETNFINGIVEIAHKSNAWLLTNGYNVGIVQLVGQAVSKVKLTTLKATITAIGICKWGSIKDVEQLTDPKREETDQITTTTSNTSDKKNEQKRRSGEWGLEMNHTHYLMLDDGRYRYFNTADYRTRLAIQMARLQHENDIFVPVVTIVVEGGEDSISNMYYDLRSNIPVVIIEGSGRAADFFNRSLLYTKDLENNVNHRKIVYGIDELAIADEETPEPRSAPNRRNQSEPPESNHRASDRTERHLLADYRRLSNIFKPFREHIKDDLQNTLFQDHDPVSNIELITNQVMYCLQPAVRSDITVYNLNSDTNLSETIFRSICRSRQKLSKRKVDERNDVAKTHQQKSSDPHNEKLRHAESLSRSHIDKREQNVELSALFNLAMDWDCIDVAKEFIFQSSLDNILNKTKAFKDAMKNNLPAFVYEFLKLGIDPSEIFFSKEEFFRGKKRYKQFINDLYTQDAVNSSKTHLKYFIEADKAALGKKINGVDALNTVLSSLVGDYMHKLYFNTLQDEEKYRILWGLKKKPKYRSLYRHNDIEEHGSISADKKMSIQIKQMSQDYIMRDLFLWAVLMNYHDMAIVFLSHLKYRICSALIATKVFKKYHEIASYGEIKDGYRKSAEYFEKYAIDCLDKCDDHDAGKACEIILQQNELYGYVTCLQVAADAEDKLFIATQCSVEAMNNIWYDKLYPEQTRKRNHLALFVGFVSLGLLAPVFVSYRQIKKEPKKNDATIETYRSNGINYCDPYLLEYSNPPVPFPTGSRYPSKLWKFHMSLSMKFYYHVISYCFFLLLFSYVLLFNFAPPINHSPSIHWTEILTIILVSCMLIEEIHYFLCQDSLTFAGKWKNCLRDFFKPMTLLAFALFYIGLIVRFRYANSEEEFFAARVIMAIDLEIWWLRSLSFIIVIPFLGPHLVAIGKMLKDLAFFMCIIAIVMAGYGVASRSMVYYPIANNFTTETGGSIDASFDGRSVFRQIAYPVYYLLYGQFGNELSNLDANPNAGWSITTEVLLAIHILFVNILLTNLLIAMFSKRFDEVYEDTRNIWHSQQYLFTREYYTRSPFLLPISLFYDIYRLSRMIVFFIRRSLFKKPTDYNAEVFKIIPQKNFTIKDWHEFEDASTYEYAHDEVKAFKTTCTKSTYGLDSVKKEKKDDILDHGNDSSDALNGFRQVQDNLMNLNSIIEEMKGELEQRSNKTDKPS